MTKTATKRNAPAAKKAPAAKTTKVNMRGVTSPEPKKGSVTGNMSVTLVSLCAKYDRDPKVVRAKARRIRDELAPHLFPATSDERWAFKPSSVKAVEALLFGKAS